MEKKQGQRFNIHIDNEIKEVFVGHHTLFSVLGFTIGGIVMGGTIKEYLHAQIGLFPSLLVGSILMIASGLVLHKFSDRVIKESNDDEVL